MSQDDNLKICALCHQPFYKSGRCNRKITQEVLTFCCNSHASYFYSKVKASMIPRDKTITRYAIDGTLPSKMKKLFDLRKTLTLDQIEKEIGGPRPSIRRVLSRMRKHKTISRVRKSLYTLNPDPLPDNWKEPIYCVNFHICGNKAVAENGDHKWYCFSCFQELVDDIDDVEIDESLQVCQIELIKQTA